MGTRFTALAAPVDASTGDRRRFAEGALSSAPLPMPLRWVRADVGGHDGAVTLGAIQTLDLTGAEARVGGVIFDDIDATRMPRLAEDVAEAMKLIVEGVLGLSVDLDAVDAVLVRLGTDTPATDADFEDPDAELEMLITKAQVRSATLVAIPAFVETNHTIQLEAADVDEEVEDEIVEETEDELYALVASMGSAGLVPFSAFLPPVPITGPTPITYDLTATPPVAYGHVATWSTCHAGFDDVCLLAPRDPNGGAYRDFHVHRVETTEGTVYAGRITAGGTHPPMGDFAVDAMAVRRAHDAMATVAHVRAVEDEWGLLICGPIVDGLDDETLRIMSRRKVSPDWRETVDGLSMIEILALPPGPRAVSEPGFPVQAGFASGRQVALVASIGPEAPDPAAERAVDLADVFREAYTVIKEGEAKEARERAEAEAALAELAAVCDRDSEIELAGLAAVLEV